MCFSLARAWNTKNNAQRLNLDCLMEIRIKLRLNSGVTSYVYVWRFLRLQRRGKLHAIQIAFDVIS